MQQSRSRQSRNELTHPSAPISGNTLMNLKLVLESVVDDGEVRDLDLAMLLNVPVNRLGRLKKAGAPAGAAETPEPDDEQDDATAATIRPNQAILVRLLLKHPEYAPLTMRPGNAEMFELIAPLMPGTGSNGKIDRKSTRLNSSHVRISYAVFCLKKKKKRNRDIKKTSIKKKIR